MMMARDHTPQRPQLDARSIESLTAALADYLAKGDVGESLHGVLRSLAEEARAKDMHAEHLLVALKDAWYALPSVSALPDGEPQNRMLQRVVTLCIREYYSA